MSICAEAPRELRDLAMSSFLSILHEAELFLRQQVRAWGRGRRQLSQAYREPAQGPRAL